MSRSSNNQRQQTSSATQSTSVGIGGANEGVVITGDGNTYQQTDYNAINRAFDTTADALEFGAGAQQAAYSVVDRSIDSLDDGLENVLTFAGENNAAAFEIVSNTANQINDIAENALTFGGESQMAAYEFIDGYSDTLASNQANVFEWAAGQQQDTNSTALDFLDFADRETDDTLEFAAGLVGAVIDADQVNDSRVHNQQNAILDSINAQRTSVDDLLESGQGLFESAIDNIQESHNNSMVFAGEAVNRAFQQSNSAIDKVQAGADKALDFVTSSASSLLNGIAQFSVESSEQQAAQNAAGLTTIANISASEDQKTRQDLMKLAGGFAVLMTAGMLYMGRKKA